MENTHKYYDLCIPFTDDPDEMTAILDELVDYDYKTVAIEKIYTYDPSEVDTGRGAEIFPEPEDIKEYQEKYFLSLKLIQRLTIVYSDPGIGAAMNASLNLKKYRIIAAAPMTDLALKHSCSEFNGDLISFDPGRGELLYMPHKLLKVALQREMFFELSYAAALTDSLARRELMRFAGSLRIRRKMCNVIITSGACHVQELRTPYDVHNLSYVFGMSKKQGKQAIDRNCRLLFMRACARRIGKTFGFAKRNNEMEISDTSDEEDPVVVKALETVQHFKMGAPSDETYNHEKDNILDADDDDTDNAKVAFINATNTYFNSSGDEQPEKKKKYF